MMKLTAIEVFFVLTLLIWVMKKICRQFAPPRALVIHDRCAKCTGQVGISDSYCTWCGAALVRTTPVKPAQ